MMAHSKATGPTLCWRCGAAFSNRTVQTGICCILCNRTFHRKCYLAETGINKDETRACVCCLSGILRMPQSSCVQQNPVATKFLRDGYCVISLATCARRKKYVLETLEKYRANADRYFKSFMRAYEAQLEFSTKAPTLESGFSNFRERGSGRYEMISSEIEKEVISVLGNCDGILNTLELLLTSASSRVRVKKRLMSTGCFYSLPGSSKQQIHTDGPPLSSVLDLFPYAINVFIPLVSVDKRNGTEFFPGSHRIEWSSRSLLRKKSIAPVVPFGEALLFDYRVLHRGLANRLGSTRSCYYATFVRSWYEDKFNFSSGRYKTALSVPSYLLTRRGDEHAQKRQRTE
ncbi:ADP-ribosylation factor-like protein 3A [Trypanosoma rangeli]|uniref:ADP-ribosylation factor-like protein 3A n=1 Tax=Trypanosoma rangeli TaxID=5698 RepID=A0A422NRL2_TRYRA|nr:ADP-ribosylation factor-like protein 3A [Trypanosoma rangeli]RNF08117.1 ADP-ribosylation factor-like protein 3A [Trypanosoma rangeli]|eukprot:RNF08117.1 ADP-ribosylation factor-like protein 3A [Trypanosoma rangeli]